MRIAVAFGEESVEFEVPEDRLLGAWSGPVEMPADEIHAAVARALADPREFPPLGRAVVPGDHVVLAVEPRTPGLEAILRSLVAELAAAGVEPADILVLEPSTATPLPPESLPSGVRSARHDPDDRDRLAYLATSAGERRIYLNRELTDADVVVPVGRLGVDASLGHRGPWSVLFPGLADTEALRAFRDGSMAPSAALAESAEVGWLLGSAFAVGVVEGTLGPVEIVAGSEAAVRSSGILAADAAWTCRVDERADLVVAGVGGPGRLATLEDLASSLATATSAVRRGGKVVALSRVGEPIGPALQRLTGADDSRAASASLRGAEGEPDYASARKIAEALAWADIYLFSDLDESVADDLAFIPLSRAEEARRLVASSPSTLFLSQADRTRVIVDGESEEDPS